jgi:hypothetical protein
MPFAWYGPRSGISTRARSRRQRGNQSFARASRASFMAARAKAS